MFLCGADAAATTAERQSLRISNRAAATADSLRRGGTAVTGAGQLSNNARRRPLRPLVRHGRRGRMRRRSARRSICRPHGSVELSRRFKSKLEAGEPVRRTPPKVPVPSRHHNRLSTGRCFSQLGPKSTSIGRPRHQFLRAVVRPGEKNRYRTSPPSKVVFWVSVSTDILCAIRPRLARSSAFRSVRRADL